MPRSNRILLSGIFLTCLGVISGCSQKQLSYSRDIRPILERNCLECHNPNGTGFAASGLSMESYESLMKGTHFGPVINPGDALSSTLLLLVSGKADESIRMPHDNRKPLNHDEIEKLNTWVAQGAKNN